MRDSHEGAGLAYTSPGQRLSAPAGLSRGSRAMAAMTRMSPVRAPNRGSFPLPRSRLLSLFLRVPQQLRFTGDLLRRSAFEARQRSAQVVGQTSNGGDICGAYADACFHLDARAQFEVAKGVKSALGH